MPSGLSIIYYILVLLVDSVYDPNQEQGNLVLYSIVAVVVILSLS